jgi:hypothetical protein
MNEFSALIDLDWVERTISNNSVVTPIIRQTWTLLGGVWWTPEAFTMIYKLLNYRKHPQNVQIVTV